MKAPKPKVDKPKKADAKLSVRKGAASAATASAKGKAGKDPNKPKRPPSAFFVFMGEFREQYKAKNPNNKSVAAVGKAAGDKWKSMSEAEKAPYTAKANKLKSEYTKTIAAYNKKQSEAPRRAVEEEEESDKSKSEINDDDEEDGSEEEDEEDDD